MTTEIAMLIVGVLLAEGTEIAPWLAKRLVRWSAHIRYLDRRRAEVRAEEWEAVIEHRPGKLFKLATALLFTLQAGATWTSRLLVRLRVYVQAKRNHSRRSAPPPEAILTKIIKEKQSFLEDQQRSTVVLNDRALTPVVNRGVTVLIDYGNTVTAHVPGCSCQTDRSDADNEAR